ncbi:myopalladin [Nematolebias whitei]|uniref:myopalladin n=1 Tax=Nematolebias whitei TaxID=451745 RepID=UPI001896E5E3|nr:myopalladin [Nematolebias whitei]
MSRSDASSSRLQIYGTLKGKGDDALGHHDTPLPDLSAFLSQEELDKSVNLARQAIGHEPSEERAEAKASVTSVPSNISPSVSGEWFSNHSVPVVPPSINQPSSEVPVVFSAFTSNRKMHKPSLQENNMIQNSRDSTEGFNHRNSPAKSAPFGLETQSKKEFLNKAADFIEELSSLFKANSSKRVRPRACKAHRSRVQNKNQSEETTDPLSSDSRERAILPLEMERPNLVVSHHPVVQQDVGSELMDFQDYGLTKEERFDLVSQDVGDQAESPHQAELACEPPHFIQKLKSREVPEGTKVRLDCIVRGHPVPEVRWFCEGKELEDSPDIQIITNAELHSLVIAEAFEEDTGRYSCFASNVYGTDSTSAEIYVEGASSSDSEADQHFEHITQLQRKPLKSSPFVPQLSNPTHPVEKDSSSQPAEPSKEPEEEPSSIKGPEEASQVVRTSSAVLPALEVSEASQPKGGTEATAVEEPAGIWGVSDPDVAAAQLEQTAAPLGLNSAVSSEPSAPGRLSQNPVSNHNNSQESNGQSIMAAPVFTKNLQDLTAAEGQLVVLECRVRGVPSPQVDWSREGKLIEDSPEFRILQKKEICTLVIAEVFPEDSGRFTCTASNSYGTVSSTAALKVKGTGSSSTHVRPGSGFLAAAQQAQECSPSGPAGLSQPEVPVPSSTKPHSSTIRLEPLVSSALRLDPVSTSTLHLEPHSSSMLCPNALRSSLAGPDPCSSGLKSLGTPALDPPSSLLGSTAAHEDPQSGREMLANQTPFTFLPAAEHRVSRPSVTLPDPNPGNKGALNGTPSVVPLPDPPPNSCLKTSALTNHKDSRSSSRRVHFKLPEDEEDEDGDQSSPADEDLGLASAGKEPPPVLAKPKLDPSQLQLLHSQVLMEQHQETKPQTQTQPQTQPQFQIQVPSQVQSPQESPLWSPRLHCEPQVPFLGTTSQPTPRAAAPLTTTPLPVLAPTSGPPPRTTAVPLVRTSSAAQIRTSSMVTSPPPAPQFHTPPALSAPPGSHASTVHASHLNLSPAALARTAPKPQACPPPAPMLNTVESTVTLQQITSPTPLLRSTHASLMNLTSISHTFNYTRPKEFIAAQTLPAVRSPSPTESPVPLLQELAAELNSSAASSPTPPPFSPPPRFSPTRVLKSPASPPSLVSSPTPGSALAFRAQSPPQASSPTSSSSSPSPIQNPVAFLSSVLPSLTPSQPTNSMGLPKGAPLRVQKKTPKTRLPSAENIRESKELLLHDIEKKLRFPDEAPQVSYQQKLHNKGETASRPLGPNIPATVFNYDEEYKVSNFEQRLMSEIEFRLERTPVEESDDEVQHDDVPTGKCIAPIFERKLKNFKAMEGVPVTFTCKVLGIPLPKVYWFKDGKQILRKNLHYRKIREGDGTCALHIDFTTSDDDGNYTVMAANPQGRISCSGHLIVQSGPPRNRLTPIQSQRVRARIQEVEGEQTQERFFRPHFLQAPGDMMAHEGKLCRLDCKVSGLPSPELMWLVNGRPIYPDLLHRMLVRENGVHSLVIDPLTQNDAGTYTCIASNKAGQSSFNLELKVVEKEMKQPPQFVEKLQNMGIPEGIPIRLECRVAGTPPPLIFWKKDNETISKTKDRISMSQDATGYVCLLIQPTTKDDAGWYTVAARNDAGVVSCTCRLDIYAQWHQSVPAPMRKAQRASGRYSALTGQGLDVRSAFSTSEASPFLFTSSPPEATLESEEL